jgi:hypothetical protein
VQIQWRRAAAGLLLFGVSFGYVEAVVVVYLRTIYDPIRHQVHPERPAGDLFPLTTQDQLRTTAPDKVWFVRMEVVREAATLVMLAAVAVVVTGDRHLWLPAFCVAFGTWDLFFYIFLKLLADWPASLLAWDILFLIPVPWVAPVLAPTIVSVSLIGGGLAALQRPVHMKPVHWILLALGSMLVLLSFMEDFRNTTAGGLPHPFLWSVFIIGVLAGLAAFLHAVLQSK